MNIKENMLINETHYCEYACLDKDAVRLHPYTEKTRPNYFHDIDKIIYSDAYTRYMDKTQVFSLINDDHISKRMTHVQLVSKIARTIGRALKLNEDLIEAASLGHDIGHVPFGHLGEYYLDELSIKYTNTRFKHNVQSVRTLSVLEKNGKGVNLTIQVMDAILCHNGEFIENNYTPVNKTIEDFINDYENEYLIETTKKLIPMTLEGCVVRISDIIGYLGRDIEDAIRLKVLKKKDLPESIISILGSSNTSIIDTIICDIINNSIGKNCISMSPHIYKAIKDLKKFNYEHIYDKAMTKNEKEQVHKMFISLYEYYLNDLKNKNKSSDIYTEFLNNMNDEYKNHTSNERIIIDYISGMTDDFFIAQYEKRRGLK